jgi:hypothetical protein
VGLFLSARGLFPRFGSVTIPNTVEVLPDDQRALLQRAIERAEQLVDDLRQKRAELDQNPPMNPEVDLPAGRQALEDAIASARRTAAALRDAWELAFEDPAADS